MKKAVKRILSLTMIFCLNISFSQKEFKANVKFKMKPMVDISQMNIEYVATIKQENEDINIGEMIPSNRSSKTHGVEYDWVDRKGFLIANCLNVNGFKNGNDGLKIDLTLSSFTRKYYKQSDKPHTKTPEGRNLYNYDFVYAQDQRLTIEYQGQKILDTLLGSINDNKNFNYYEKNIYLPYGNNAWITYIDYEYKVLFPKIRRIISQLFEFNEGTIAIKFESLGKKSPAHLNDILINVASSINNNYYDGIEENTLESAIKTFTNEIDNISDEKTLTKMQYNLSILYFLMGDIKKAKYYMSLDKKNTKNQNSFMKDFVGADAIKEGFNKNLSLLKTGGQSQGNGLVELVKNANEFNFEISRGLDLLNLIDRHENSFNK